MQKPIFYPLLLLVLLQFVLALPAGAAPLAAQPRSEVEALQSALEKSGCEFNRNGSWYSGTEAKGHLLRKLEYLEGKNMVQTADQFIERGAATSSSSGKPYLVRCANTTAIESRKWLEAQLVILRAAGRGSAPKTP